MTERDKLIVLIMTALAMVIGYLLGYKDRGKQ